MLGHVKVVGGLFRAVPVRSWKERLGRHIERCPVCQARLASREESRRFLYQTHDVGGLDGLWPAVRRAIGRSAPVLARNALAPPGPVRLRPGRRWAAAFGGFAAAAVLTAGLIRALMTGPGSSTVTREAGGEFRLHYAQIAGEPAQTFVFHDPDEKMVIVWVDRIL